MIIQKIRTAMWEFEFHYAIEPEELYLHEEDYISLIAELGLSEEEAALRYGFNFVDGKVATLFGMVLYRHIGPTMLIHRHINTVWGWVGELGSKGVYHHAVLGDEEFAMYSEVPR